MTSQTTSGRTLGQRMGLAALLLAASTLLSRLLGFLREAVIAYKHGATAMTDAYYAAFTLPDLMSYFLAGGALSITFIPLFTSYRARGDEEGGWRLFSTVATTMLSLLAALTVVAMVFAEDLVPLLVPGFRDPAQLALVAEMTRIVLPAQLAFYASGLLMATLYTREIFWPAAVSPLIYNLGIIAGGTLLGPWLGIQGFAWGALAGAILGPLGVPLWAARKHVRFQWHWAPLDPGFRRFVILTIPLMVGVSLVSVDEWLLRYFASSHDAGAITWLNNARRLMLVLFAVLGQAAGQAALPYLTRLFHEGRTEQMEAMLGQSLRGVAFVSAVATAALVVMAEPLVTAVFLRGAFTPTDVALTSQLLVLFALGLSAWSIQSVGVRGFYAREDTLTPMIVGTVVTALTVPIYLLLQARWQTVGLAAATSVGISLNAVATLVVYRMRRGPLLLWPVGRALLRGAAVGGAAALAAAGARAGLAPLEPWLAVLPLSVVHLGWLAVMAGVFGATCLGLVFWLEPEELAGVMDKVRRRLGARIPALARWLGPRTPPPSGAA